mgnify:CR=1 FL=1
MKRMKRVLALGMAVLMCMGLTACGKDFDAAGYTKSVLDANYHAQYDKYAEYRGISESDAKKEVTEGMRTQIESAFTGMDVSDDLADFTVKDAKKQDDDSYVVTVVIKPSDVFRNSSNYVNDIATEYADQGKDPTQTDVLMDILVESLNRAMEANSYGDETTLEVHVTADKDGAYGIEESEMETLEATMFPGE